LADLWPAVEFGVTALGDTLDEDEVLDAVPEPSSTELEDHALEGMVPGELPEIVRGRTKVKPRSFRACYACVDVGGRPLTAREDASLRIVATALLDARVWIGSTNAWMTTTDGTLLERLEFRTLAPKPAERLSYVEVVCTATKRARPPRQRPQTKRDP
jgi:hypothetical protein